MKIRNGFVSNSSSSSFIVVFPKKPKNSNEVLKYMFGGEDYNVKYYDCSLSTKTISDRVFEDIKKIEGKLTLENVIDAFVGRYYYSEFSGWINEGYSKYFGSNNQLLSQLEDLYKTRMRKDKEIQEKMFAISGACLIPVVPFATGSFPNDKTKKPYTKKQIKAYEEYSKKRSSYLDNHKEYQELNKQIAYVRNESWNEISKIEEQLAKEDAELFLKDSKGKFIFEVEYSDNDGNSESLMEHGGIFKGVPHIQISHH